MRPLMRFMALLPVLAACVPAAGAQDALRGQIERHRDGLVSLSYAARADVCGSATTLRIGSDISFTTTGEGPWTRCDPGPVRVLIRRAEGQTVWLRVVMDDRAPEAVTDLGVVPARAASAYFLDFARTADGRVGRDALLPAVVADSSETWRGLMALARDRSLSRGLRESAVTWLGRELASGAADATATTDLLVRLMGDVEEPVGVRTRAVTALGRSTDPRSREALRREARNASLGAGIRTQVLRALGGREATPSDYRLLRELWSTLEDTRAQEAVISALADAGGGENVRWLLGVADGATGSSAMRARAVNGAVRAGASTNELSRLYDTGPDRRVKEALIEGLLRIGDREAIARVTAIARSETDPAVRRSAINRLSRSAGADAVDVLRDMVERP